jgi:lambda repressor-like predicted transcriptional regulator
VLDVERWAELRREHFVRGVSIKELVRRTGLARNTIRTALRSPAPPTYERSCTASKLDPFKEEIHRQLVGRRVEVRVSQREITAHALDTGELAAKHERCFAKHRTITALTHARSLRERRGGRDEVAVEQRPLSVYDQLIAS